MENRETPQKAQNRSIPPLVPPLDPLQRYTVPEASTYLRQSRAKTYQDINNGSLEVIKDGSRTYITGRSIVARSGGAVDSVQARGASA